MPDVATRTHRSAVGLFRRRAHAVAPRRPVFVQPAHGALGRCARRSVRAGLLVVFAVALCSSGVQAHSLSTADSGVGVGTLLLIVAGCSVGSGLLAVAGRHAAGLGVPSRLVATVSGPLFVLLGGLTLAVAAGQQLGVGLAGLAVGLLAAVGLAGRVSDGGCATLTVSAIVLHRFVEGVVLGVLFGLAVSVLGVVVLTAHASAESIALGGRSGFRPRQAAGSVVLAGAALVAGTALGGGGLLAISPTGQLWTTAAVGGLLLALGVAETHGHVSTRLGRPHVVRS